MLDLLYNGMGIRARVCVSPLSSYLYIISMIHSHAKGSAHNLSINEWRDYDILAGILKG